MVEKTKTGQSTDEKGASKICILEKGVILKILREKSLKGYIVFQILYFV